MAVWNAAQYLKFEGERTQPAIDLINRINIINPAKIIDIGCGPGNSTQVLLKRFPNANIIGIDSSKEMIDRAKKSYPNLSFDICDAGKDLLSMGSDYSIVFSNACIQWIPNHPKLLKEMFSLLSDNAALAVQVPINQAEPLYTIVDEVASDKRWGFEDVELEVNQTLKQSEYFDILSELSDDFSIWETTYLHRMSSHRDLVEWVKGTKLRPYLNALPPELAGEFEGEIVEKVTKTYPIQRNGEIIFRFRRLFFTAYTAKNHSKGAV